MAVAKSIPVHPMQIRFNGIFDWEGLYKMMHDWLVDRYYYVNELPYKHKVPTVAGYEQEIKWRGWRKVNEWMKYEIRVYFHILDMNDVEVVLDGKKKTLVKGRMFIQLQGFVEIDYTGRRAKTAFGQFLNEFYAKYVIKKTMETRWWEELNYSLLKLQKVIRQYLDMSAKGHAYEDVW